MSEAELGSPNYIRGSTSIASSMGAWPSFHDAEILSMHLGRDGTSRLIVKLPRDQGTIEFTVQKVEDLELSGFSRQNVVSGIVFEQDESGSVTMRMDPCYGLNGWIKAETFSAMLVDQPSNRI